jgi:hypothetical protein
LYLSCNLQLVAGFIWLVQSWEDQQIVGDAPVGQLAFTHSQLNNAVGHWVPALGFSVGLDTVTTGMIAGRLIYHHRTQKKLGAHTAYLPLVAIFIESAALSLISKIIQISIPSIAIEMNPLNIPFCMSKEFT